MEYVVAPFRTMAEWAGIAYSAYPGVCQGVVTVFGFVVLWVAFQVIAHRYTSSDK